uniref:CSON000836 protein n=1 Tax=Culicoides sonorensis TaxID=179676 RepID=A0A336KWY5_CULSO
MSVHYKFKSALDFDTITFDGLHINVADLKKAIVHQKRLGKNVDFDLQISNAQTKEEYNEDSMLIPKNTSLIIARIPLAPHIAKRNQLLNQNKNPTQDPIKTDSEARNVDLAAMDGSEKDKIHAMMQQSTVDYDPTNYQKVRGGGMVGEVPATYRCHRCHKPGHWIKNCPLGPPLRDMPEVKRNTGIPRSFIERDKNQQTEQVQAVVPELPKPEVPEDLICSICKDLFTDAVMIPCCGSSFCDECVRTALLESEDNECPDCQEKGTSPASLIPNRFLRRSVNNFKNETGYTVPMKKKEIVKQRETEEIATEQEEEKTPSENEDAKPSEDQENPGDDHFAPVEHEVDENKPEPHPNEVPLQSNQHPDPHHYQETDEYAIQTTNPYSRPENKGDVPLNDMMPRGPQAPPYGMQPMHHYPNQPYPHQPPHMNQNYPPMMRPYNQHMQGYGRPQYFHPRGYNHGPMYSRARHSAPYPDVNTIYRGVAQTVGTGIIDDPLEAFNRIMREKERQKEEQARRRSPNFTNKYRRSRSPDRRRKRRSNSFENSPIKRHVDRRVFDRDRKRRRSRSYSSSRSYSRTRSRSPPRKRSFTPRKFSKSPVRRSRSISPHANKQPIHRNHRRDYRDSMDRGVRKEKSPVSSSRTTKHKEKDHRNRSKTKEIKKKSRSKSPSRVTSKSSKQSSDKSRHKSKERSSHHETKSQASKSERHEKLVEPKKANPLEFNDVLPPGVEEFDEESWQISDNKYGNKIQGNEIQANADIEGNPETKDDQNNGNDDTKSESKNSKETSKDDKDLKKEKANRDKKRKKKEKEVETKKPKKHKREKSEKAASEEKQKHVDEKPSEKSNEPEKAPSDHHKTPEIEKTLTPPLCPITKSDSILDLYDNMDMDIFSDHGLNQSEDLLTIPEPSKWEKEDMNLSDSPKKSSSVSRDEISLLTSTAAAKELKSSEIRGSKDNSPLLSAVIRPSTDTTVHNLKISVPSKSSNHSERSIELKSSTKYDKIRSVVNKDNKDTKKPSIKDRLGEKVREKSAERRSSEHKSSDQRSSTHRSSDYRSSDRKLTSAAIRNDDHKSDKDKDRDRIRSTAVRSHQSSSHTTEKSRSSHRRLTPSPVKPRSSSSKNVKPRTSSTSSSSSSDSNDDESKHNKKSKKEKKIKKKRSSKSSDESNVSLDKKKKSSKKKSKKEKKKKSKHKS